MAGIIRASFNSAEIIRTDQTGRVAQELLQALVQISSTARRVYADCTRAYVGVLTKAIGSWELSHGLDARDAAETIWTGILGCHLLSAARGDEPYDRLARNWGVLLTALAPKSELPALNDSLTDMPGRYQVAV